MAHRPHAGHAPPRPHDLPLDPRRARHPRRHDRRRGDPPGLPRPHRARRDDPPAGQSVRHRLASDGARPMVHRPGALPAPHRAAGPGEHGAHVPARDPARVRPDLPRLRHPRPAAGRRRHPVGVGALSVHGRLVARRPARPGAAGHRPGHRPLRRLPAGPRQPGCGAEPGARDAPPRDRRPAGRLHDVPLPPPARRRLGRRRPRPARRRRGGSSASSAPPARASRSWPTPSWACCRATPGPSGR